MALAHDNARGQIRLRVACPQPAPPVDRTCNQEASSPVPGTGLDGDPRRALRRGHQLWPVACHGGTAAEHVDHLSWQVLPDNQALKPPAPLRGRPRDRAQYGSLCTCARRLAAWPRRAREPPFCVAIGCSRVAADPGYLRGVGIAAETGAAQGRQLGRLDPPGPGRRAGNCGHLAQPRSRRRLAGPWSVRLPYLRSSRHGCGHRRFGGKRYKPRSVLVLLRTGVQGLVVTTSPGGIRGPP